MKKQKMSKEEKTLYKQTPLYKYKKNRTLQYVLGTISWITLIIPESVLIGINWEEWITTQVDTIKVALGLVLTAIASLFMLYKKFTKEIKFSYLGLVVGFWVVTGICYLFSALLTEMVIILMCASIGLTSSLLLDIPTDMFKQNKIRFMKEANIPTSEDSRANRIRKSTKRVFGAREKDIEKEPEATE